MSKQIVRGLVVTVALCAVLAATNYAFAFVTSGTIYEVQDEFGSDIGSTVDHWYFTVNSAGIVVIDTLSWEVDSEDFDFDSDYNETIMRPLTSTVTARSRSLMFTFIYSVMTAV